MLSNLLQYVLVPANSLAATYTRYDGETLDGDTSKGFDIVDSFHAPLSDPSYATSFNVNTMYGGGYGTGMTGDFGNYSGPDTFTMSGI
uniref:Uncharacterized protein n=1 Tax=Hemiselmis andersenii TaxID=464988 RepID=A0A7S0U7P6_HEMAN